MIFENIDEFINYNNDHLISFTVSTYNNLNLLRNLFTSAFNNNLKLVFFALDNKIADYINKTFNVDVVLFLLENQKQNNDCYIYKYGSKEWVSIVYNRYFITHRLLKDGRNVVYMDSDVFINRNYVLDIKEKLREHDLYIQSNDKDCCTGFYAMKSTKKLINFFNRKHMTNKLKCYDFGGSGGPSDQKFFNHYIGGKNMKEFDCVLLERNFYPNGNYYYDNNDIINEYCYIIHFNCLKGEYKKIKKIIEYNKLVTKLIDYLPNDQETLEQKDISEYKNLIDSVNIYDNKDDDNNNDDDNNYDNNNDDDNNDDDNDNDDNDNDDNDDNDNNNNNHIKINILDNQNYFDKDLNNEIEEESDS